jgi:HK97 family phage major capsid protein
MSKALELRQERHTISLEMGLALEKNNMARFRELDAKQDGLRAQIEALEHHDALATELNRVDRSSLQLPPVGDTNDSITVNAEHTRTLNPEERQRATPEYRKAFRGYLTNGDRHELRTYTPLGSVSPADGSTLVPMGFQKEVDVHMKAIGGLRLCARIISTPTGNSLQWPTEDDVSNSGHWMPQNSGPVTQTNPTFGNVTLGADLLSSDQVLVPVELFQDSAFSVEGTLDGVFRHSPGTWHG